MPIQESIKPTGNSLFSRHVQYTESVIDGNKALRTEEIATTTVDLLGHTFEVDEASMDRFDRVISFATYKFNQALAAGMPASQAYAAVYQQNSVTWKTHNNDFVEITIENICQLQELALTNLQQIWIKWG